MGCKIIGTAGSDEGVKLLKELGVDSIYNHRMEGYVDDIKRNEKDVKVIIEMLANVNLQHDLEIIGKPNGRIVVGRYL